MVEFLTDIHALCMQYNGSVTSWIRSRSRNHKVGGHADSYHLAGLAIDVVLDNENDTDAFMARAKKLGYKPLKSKGCIHIQVR